MTEGPAQPPSPEQVEKQRKKETIALARELMERPVAFPFPGLEADAYAKLKAVDEEHPGYTTPIDELLIRFEREGIKITLGKYPESGNVFVLPAGSDDIENDSISPKHLRTTEQMNERLRELITRIR